MWQVYYFDKSLQRYLPLPEHLPFDSNACAQFAASTYRKCYSDLCLIVLPL